MTQKQVYVNDKPILFSEVYSFKDPEKVPVGWKIISEEEVALEKAVADLERKKDWKGLVYLSNSPQRTWERFVGLFVLIEAAGGLVKNPEGKYLVIFRRGKWDLPKGKIDYDESPEEAAIREVEEECGVDQLTILESLSSTFHSYPLHGKRVLKKTHWYLMDCQDTTELVPQAEEDIEKAVWMSEKEIRETVYSNTFISIHHLLEGFFSTSKSI